MASIATVPSDVDAGQQPPQADSPSAEPGAVVADVPPRCEEPGQRSRDLPGIHDPKWQKEGMPDTDFNRTYPPDAWGEEAGADARVWKVYRDHQTPLDKGMLESWNKTLDVLLIFAGLFSAVLTAFLIESYKSLQPDYTQYVAVFLYAAAVSNNRTGGVFPPLDTLVSPDRFVQTSAAQRWTNGLWFSSLVISLAVALLCILVKQWLDEYDSHITSAAPTPQYWARRHSLYSHGLRKWGVPGLISFLPLLLHLSLFLFFAGLILFLRPLDGAISSSLLAMVSSIAGFYVLSLVLPAWRIECPSYTPLLAQAFLVVSRVISGLIYVIKPLGRYLDGDVSERLVDLIYDAEQSLESIQLRTRQRLASETRQISNCYQELDGYTLSTLVRLSIDGNKDAVNTAFEAIGAVTSTRTMEIISRKSLHEHIRGKIIACDLQVPWTEAGHAIISRARLLRAQGAMSMQGLFRINSMAKRPYSHGLRSQLDIDGLLLEAVCHETDDQFDFASLIHPLQSLHLNADSSRTLPLRSTCLILLEQFSRRPYAKPSFLSCFLLVFCAGDFACSDKHESARALQSVATVLRTHCSITMPVHGTREADNLCAVVNGLWTMLADSSRYNINIVTAQVLFLEVARFLVPNHGLVWAQISGLSTFLRSPIALQCIGVKYGLAFYISVFECDLSLDYGEMNLEYWTCIATLLQLGCRTAQLHEVGGYLASHYRLFIIDPIHWQYFWRIQIGPYATHDDWYEPALSAFLTGDYAIATWTGASSPDLDDRSVYGLSALAYRISIVLCRRQRLGRANDIFVPAFFSGSFLFARFRDFVSREHIPNWAGEASFEEVVLDLAKHCLKLSPAACMDICTQLEQLGEEGSELRARAVAFAERMRTPDGALSAACNSECPCMTESFRAKRGLRGVWSDIVARFRRGRTETTTAAAV